MALNCSRLFIATLCGNLLQTCISFLNVLGRRWRRRRRRITTTIIIHVPILPLCSSPARQFRISCCLALASEERKDALRLQEAPDAVAFLSHNPFTPSIRSFFQSLCNHHAEEEQEHWQCDPLLTHSFIYSVSNQYFGCGRVFWWNMQRDRVGKSEKDLRTASMWWRNG